MTASTLTAATITTAQIKALRNEALAHGDTELAEFCDLALVPHEDSDAEGRQLFSPTTGAPIHRVDARAVCARTINEAAAQAD